MISTDLQQPLWYEGLKIYPLRVPEVWRYANSRLEFLALRGEYVPIERSISFPMLALADVMQFVNMRDTRSDTLVMNRIVRWVGQEQCSQRQEHGMTTLQPRR